MNACQQRLVAGVGISPGMAFFYLDVFESGLLQGAAHGSAHLLVFFKRTTADGDDHFVLWVEHSDEVMMVFINFQAQQPKVR